MINNFRYRYLMIVGSAMCIITFLPGCKKDDPSLTEQDKIRADQLVFNSDRTGNNEIYLMKTDGSDIEQLTNNVAYENWWPRISPDRRKILFYRTPKGYHEDYSKASLWVLIVKGKQLLQLRAEHTDGWNMQGHGEWSPDGKNIAMFGSVGPYLEIFVTDSSGKHPIQYTNRRGYNTDVSWSPDGTKLIFNGYPATDYSREKYEIYVMDATPYSSSIRLTNDNYADYDPYFSPDGTKIAWLVNVDPVKGDIGGGLFLGDWAIRIADSNGKNARYLIHDGNINSKPAWSLDGQTIFFHRMEYDPLVEYKFGVFSIGVDGKHISRLTKISTGANEYPSN